jgi:hypothetical protein
MGYGSWLFWMGLCTILLVVNAMKNKEPWSLYRVSYINNVLGHNISTMRDFKDLDKAMDYMMDCKKRHSGKKFVIEKVTMSYEIVARG